MRDERLSRFPLKSFVGDGAPQDPAQARVGPIEVTWPSEIGFAARDDEEIDIAVERIFAVEAKLKHGLVGWLGWPVPPSVGCGTRDFKAAVAKTSAALLTARGGKQ